jgi:hypothetical protein
MTLIHSIVGLLSFTQIIEFRLLFFRLFICFFSFHSFRGITKSKSFLKLIFSSSYECATRFVTHVLTLPLLLASDFFLKFWLSSDLSFLGSLKFKGASCVKRGFIAGCALSGCTGAILALHRGAIFASSSAFVCLDPLLLHPS